MLLAVAAAALSGAPTPLRAGPPETGLITPRDYNVPAPRRTYSTTAFDGGSRKLRLGEYPGVQTAARVVAPARTAATAERPSDADFHDAVESQFDAALRDGVLPPLMPDEVAVPPASPEAPFSASVPPGPVPPAPVLPSSPAGEPDASGGVGGPQPAVLDAAAGEPLGVPFGDSGLVVAPRPAGAWRKQVLPAGLLYKSYLAGEKEPRFALQTLHETGRGMIWEAALGGRVGIYRYGTPGVFHADGFQIDIEGASFVRLDLEQAQDVDAADFRFGVPLTYRCGPWAYKFAYYHISSHTGDEYLVKHPTYTRINYVRENFLLGVSYDVNQDWRVYGEVGYGWHVSGGAKPWELQFGAEYSPLHPFADRGHAPFAAVNIHLREDFGMGGSINAEAGWQWRGAQTNHLFRVGVQYFNGKSMQYSFFDRAEELIGVGMWFDY